MILTSVFFNFINFFSKSSDLPIFQHSKSDCVNFCSSFFMSTLPGVDDAKLIKQSKVGLSLANE